MNNTCVSEDRLISRSKAGDSEGVLLSKLG